MVKMSTRSRKAVSMTSDEEMQEERSDRRFNKFECFKCKRKRWVTEYREACAREFGRTATCLFCIIAQEQENLKKALKDSSADFKAEIEGLRDSMKKELSALREEIAGRRVSSEASAPPVDNSLRAVEATQRALTETLNKEVAARREALSNLQKQIEGSISGLRQEIGHPITAGPRVLPPPAAAPRKEGEESVETVVALEEYFDTLATPTPPLPLTSKKNKKRQRKRIRKKTAEKKDDSSTLPPVNLLLGDSLVGRTTGKTFTRLRPENTVKSFPGANIKRVTDEIGKLKLNRDSTLILSCGGNDFFFRDGRTGSPQRILEGFRGMIRASKKVANRVIVVGITPRKHYTGQYSKAVYTNTELRRMCSALSVRYVDTWNMFFRNDDMVVRDGTHFSEAGATAFARLIDSRLYKPLRRHQTQAAENSDRRQEAGNQLPKRQTVTMVKRRDATTQTVSEAPNHVPCETGGKRGRVSSSGQSLSPDVAVPTKRIRQDSPSVAESEGEVLLPSGASSPSSPGRLPNIVAQSGVQPGDLSRVGDPPPTAPELSDSDNDSIYEDSREFSGNVEASEEAVH